MKILPINPTSDQQLIGETIESAGFGLRLPKRARSAAIRDAVTIILADDRIRSRAHSIGSRIRAMRPGAEVAADTITALVSGQ